MGALQDFLIPDPPRCFPGRRGVKILLRSVHVLAAGILTGAYAFETPGELRALWLVATAATGLTILLLDLHESCAFLLQTRGLVVAGKLAIVSALPLFGDLSVFVLGALVVVSVVFSHAPARIRYAQLIGRKVRGAQTRG